MGPTVLSDALAGLVTERIPDLLVGFETSDDAAVYRVGPEFAVISTADFITPPVDDPYWFGQIAAANALSDVYAMGGRPLMALNLVMFPTGSLPKEQLREMLRGGHDKVAEAGAALAGGHTVDDPEPKYGLAVTGTVHPGRILTNCGAKPGDALVLTKPVGTGVLFNACRSGKLPYRDLEVLLPEVAALNKTALDVALEFDVHAATDVTGFGIAGHMLEVAMGSCLAVKLRYRALPVHPHVVAMYSRGESTGSNRPNEELCTKGLSVEAPLSRQEREVLFDPQTSGGLVIALPAGEADELVARLRAAGVSAASVVGETAEAEEASVTVI